MKASLIIFVVALVLIVLDFIEASPFPQAKGKAPPAKGKTTATAKDNTAKNTAKDNAKGKVNALSTNAKNTAKDNAKGKVNALSTNAKNNNASANTNSATDSNVNGTSQIDSKNAKNAKNANNAAKFSNPPSSDSSAQICNRNKFANGINFVKADGRQFQVPNCASTQLGEVPGSNKMTSTLILFPKNGQTVQANQVFTIKVAINNLQTGFFSDPTINYNNFAQELNSNGVIFGHCHVTVQQIVNDNQPLDPQKPAFFKGLNDPAQNGVLTTDVIDDKTGAKGLPAGNYRLCTMAGSFSHQPLIMPVANRGAQDDCIRFTAK